MFRSITKYLLIFLSKPLFLKYIGIKYGARCRFINLKPNTFGAEPYLITLGEHVTITSGVKFVNHDGGVWVLRDKYPKIDLLDKISIGNNVFIGLNSIIMPGTVVGDNTVIGAGSVVTGVVDANSVYAGVPARKLRTMDEYESTIISRGVETKGLSYHEKRTAILKQLGMRNGEHSDSGSSP